MNMRMIWRGRRRSRRRDYDRLQSRRRRKDHQLGAVLARSRRPDAGGPRHVTLGLNSLADYQPIRPASARCLAVSPTASPMDLHAGRVIMFSIRSPAKLTRCTAARAASQTRVELGITMLRRCVDAAIARRRQRLSGNLTATCIYRMLEPATCASNCRRFCDRPTIVNLTQHDLFQSRWSPDILDHN